MTQLDENESARESARAKIGADEKASRRIELADRTLKLVIAAFGAIMAVAIWVATVRSDISRHEREILENKAIANAAAEAVRVKSASDSLLFQALQAQVSINTSIIRDRDKYIDWTRTMWDDREAGRSNKEHFFIQHGFEAPSMIPNGKSHPNTNN